jgi:predicted amidohydrolase
MSVITVAAVQAAPLSVAGLPAFGREDTVSAFAADVRAVRAQIAGPALLVYPEFHLFGTEDHPAEERDRLLRAAAEPLDSKLVIELGEIAREVDAWLVAGSVCELGPNGEVFNTALVFAPDGSLAGSYRKIFPWRPFEWSTPGDRFVTVDIPQVGRLGLSICYDAWFPEVSRQLAWMGADVIVNVVKTTTPDRPQELVLARANSIANQVFTVSVNTAGPVGRGCSILVGPEGEVLQETYDGDPAVLYQTLDLSAIARVREVGTAGTNRMWSQFSPGDSPVELPLYAGRIDPGRWTPGSGRTG